MSTNLGSNDLTRLTICEGKRTVRPRQLFVAEPVSSRLKGKTVPSESTAEDAARAFAVVPRPLPFCLPRRAPRSRPRLSLGVSGSPGTPMSNSTVRPRTVRHARYGTITSEITSVSDFLAAAEGEVIDMVSGAFWPADCPKIASSLRLPHCTSEWRTARTVAEFSGIGALEHGLQEGMAEAGLKLRLLQASELENTSEGRHNSAVLRKRFPYCEVFNPPQRLAKPYPESARLLTVTTLCRHHSKMNPVRSPWETEELLGPVFERLRNAPAIETVVLENVPEFVQLLDLQERSSYTMWVEGLETCGFTQHAYVLLPTTATGDLHGRTRLLSVHTRPCGFHPAAALSTLLEDDADTTTSNPKVAASKRKGFAFNSGVSQNRFEANSRRLRPTFGRLPAYNSNLNVVIFWDGAYYQLSPWLAGRASALPDAWQSVAAQGKRKGPSLKVQASALANMVSPLQARELGFVIGSEWREPRLFSGVAALENSTRLPQLFRGRLPDEFPCTKSRYSTGGSVVLCFSDCVGQWHRVGAGLKWRLTAATSTLDELLAQAVKRKKLKPFMGVTDLRRAAEDTELSAFHRRCASMQLSLAEEVLAERVAARPPKVGGNSTWMQCDSCSKWRRMPKCFAPTREEAKQLVSWTCAMLPIACEAPEETLDYLEEEHWRCEHTYTHANDSWLLKAAKNFGADSSQWKAIKRAGLREAEFLLDFYFRSRTAEQLGERLQSLLQNRDARADDRDEPRAGSGAAAGAEAENAYELRCLHADVEAWVAAARIAEEANAKRVAAALAKLELEDEHAQGEGCESDPTNLAIPEETWVMCDGCEKWRRVGTISTSGLASAWRCEDNSDPRFASCEAAQELPSDEIDVLLGLAPIPTQAHSSAAPSSRKRRRCLLGNEAPTEDMDVVDEFDACGLSAGDHIFAAGFGPSGSRVWFLAKVLDVCTSRWPPIHVWYECTLDGCSHPLALPTCRQARVHSRDVAAYLPKRGLSAEDVLGKLHGAA